MLLLSRILIRAVIALVSAVIATASAGLPPIIQSTIKLTKLPINVEPLEYDIKLGLVDSFDEFTGEVDIFVMFKSCKNPVARLLSDVVHGCLLSLGDNMNNPEPRDRIALHIKGDLNLDNVQLLAANSMEQLRQGEGDILHVTNIEQDQLSGTMMINLDTDMPVGFYGRISIKYHASRRLKIYSETIYDAISKRKVGYHAINLEQFKARTLFPCFDESNLRVKVSLTIEHPYMDSKVLANIPTIGGQEESFGNFKRSRFQQSVPIPISSLAFAIGPYQRAEDSSQPSLDQSMNSIKVNFFEPSGHRGEGEFALKAAVSAVHWFEKRFKLHEHTKNLLHHINLVAVPSYKEWKLASALGIGLIDHNFLLIDDRFSSPERKIETALYTTLVVARQLFGHVMVPKSADDQWITDGLAYHLAIRAVDEFRPDFKMEQYVRAHHRRRVMSEVERERQHSGDSRYGLSPRAQCILRHLKGKSVFDSLKANIVHGDETRSNDIICNLIEKTTTSGVSRSDLIEAFAIDKFSSKQIDGLIRGMLSSPLNSRLDADLIMDKSGAKFQLVRRSPEGVITLPVEMNVLISSSDGANLLNIPVHPIRRLEQANGKFVIKFPKWFHLDQHAWLKVELGDGQLSPNHQVHYNKAILLRLRDQIMTREMAPNDRLAILSQQIDTVDASSMDDVWEFIEFIGYYQEEDNPDVILEVLEAMKWAIQWASHECLHYFEDHLVGIYHRLNGFETANNHDTISKQRAKATVALLLINQIYDAQTIVDGVAIYGRYQRAHEQLPGFLRTPVFMAVGIMGSSRQKEELANRLENASFAEEQSRHKLLRPLKCSAMRNTGRCLRD